MGFSEIVSETGKNLIVKNFRQNILNKIKFDILNNLKNVMEGGSNNYRANN